MKKIIVLICIGLLLICSGCNSESGITEESTEPTSEETVEAIKEKVVYKSNLSVDKEETVNVKTLADGTPYETSVEVNLKNPLNGETIKDKTNLTDIVNTEGDETYSEDGEYICWTNSGEDIHYKGNSSETLPVSVKISYYLDGNKVSAEELAHASGHVKIRFDYTNNTSYTSKVNGLNYNVKIPFICITMMYLPSENFYNIESEDGEVMTMDDSILIIGMGFPGLQDSLKLKGTDFTKNVDLKDYFEVEADVSDFELDYTATIASNGLLEDLEDKDLKDIDDMLAEVDDIDDQKADIEGSKDELEDASDKFSDLVDKLASGMNSINSTLKGMQKNLADTKTALETAVRDLLNDETFAFKEKEDDVKTQLTDLNKKITDQQTLIDGLTDETEKAQAEALKKDYENALAITNYYYTTLTTTSLLVSSTGSLDTDSVKNSIDEAFDDLIDVLDEFEDNIDDLTEDIDSGLKETVNRLKASRNADKQYNNFSGLVEGKEGSVVFIIQSDEIG